VFSLINKPNALELNGTRRDLGVVLLHSFTGSSRDMKLLGPALNAQGFTVFAPVLRGHHDRSFAGPLLGGNPDDWWEDVQAAVTRVHRECAHVAVFGLSLGGVLAMRAIADLPEVAGGGVMAAPILDGSPIFADTVAGYFDYVARYTQQEIDRNALQPAIRQQNKAIRHFAHGVARKMDGITKPVFIAQGGADQVIDPQTAQRTANALSEAQVDYHFYPHAQHILTVDPVHEQLEKDITSFLQTIASGL
jgi:carboxylesterase